MNIQESWWSTSLSEKLKERRFQKIISTMDIDTDKEFNLLDVGCATGKDFVKFLDGYENIQITGIDIDDYEINQKNVKQMKVDAEKLPFEDKSFDYIVSMGVLEHIEPIEKLCKVISEIDRVSKEYCVVVPCINTVLEPHLKSFRWQLRDYNKKKQIEGVGVNYFSDDAWLKFDGFKDASIKRFWYIPGVLLNVMIYKKK
jgi:ubiquinone/menaquinone biosynthesis C-methylase UbiE